MNSIKVFDYFQKISYDVSKPTNIGAIISLLAISTIFVFILIETCKFISPQIKKDFIIFQEESVSSKINIYLSVYIPHAPCSILSIDLEDTLDSHKTNIGANINKKRVSKKDISQVLPSVLPYKTDELLRALNEDEGCLIDGFVEVNKVPGNIHISYHAFRNVWENLVESHKEEYKKLKLWHKINHLSFGDKNIPANELNSFGIYPHSDMPNFITLDNKQPNFDYYVKIVPHLLRNDAENSTWLNHQFSLSFQNRRSEDSEMAMIMINYEMSEVTTLLTKKKNSFTQFLIDICAIVGGIFVISSIINRIILNIFDLSEKDS